jgi:hypothetical protein
VDGWMVFILLYSQGRRNDYQDALDAVDADYLREFIEGTIKPDDEKGKHDVKTDQELADFEEI